MAVVTVRNTVPDEMRRASESLPTGTGYVADALVDSLGITSPKERGELSRSWSQNKLRDHVHEAVSSAEHWYWLWKGTGVYVGRGRIKPTRAKALKFFWDRIGKWTIWKGDLDTPREKASFGAWARARGMVPFFVWPKGIPGTPYVEEAMQMAEREIDDSYVRAMRERGVAVA